MQLDGGVAVLAVRLHRLVDRLPHAFELQGAAPDERARRIWPRNRSMTKMQLWLLEGQRGRLYRAAGISTRGHQAGCSRDYTTRRQEPGH